MAFLIGFAAVTTPSCCCVHPFLKFLDFFARVDFAVDAYGDAEKCSNEEGDVAVSGLKLHCGVMNFDLEPLGSSVAVSASPLLLSMEWRKLRFLLLIMAFCKIRVCQCKNIQDQRFSPRQRLRNPT
jgi:hypothetical protein